MTDEIDPGDLDDDLPPLIGEDGHDAAGRCSEDVVATPPVLAVAGEPEPAASREEEEEEVLRAAAALRAEGRARAALLAEAELSSTDVMRAAMAEAEEPQSEAQPPSDLTVRLVQAITRDDFEECEDCILRGADVNGDCGAGMRAIHIAALRGEMFLTELLIKHGADQNMRDASGNTPLIYACHFFKQHGKGVELTAQLLYHRADPFYRVKDGKFAGDSAFDVMEKACREPSIDESVPRQMRAMLELAIDGREESFQAITNVWMSFKSQNKRLYEVSSNTDSYGYAVKSVDWILPGGENCGKAYAPTKLGDCGGSITEGKFTDLQNYSFTDEGDKVKVYATFPESATHALSDTKALIVEFAFQSVELKLTTAAERFRLRIDPLYGTIDVDQCKHRVSVSSSRVTLTLVKRHKNRVWSAIQKPR